MDYDALLQERSAAKKPSCWSISRFIAARVAACLVLVLVTRIFLLCLPSLKPTTLDIWHRLRDVSVFLFFTTVIAIGIFWSPLQSVHTRNIGAPDPYPLSSIFGEEGDSGAECRVADVAERKQSTPATRRDEKAQSQTIVRSRKDFEYPNHNLLVRGIALASSVAPDGTWFSPRGRERVAKNDDATPAHRLNESTNFHGDGHDPVLNAGNARAAEAADARSELQKDGHSILKTNAQPNSITGSAKTPKKVSFLADSGPDDNRWLCKNEAAAASASSEITKDVGATPDELNAQADIFIAKFKEQMKMQTQESFQRHPQQLSS